MSSNIEIWYCSRKIIVFYNITSGCLMANQGGFSHEKCLSLTNYRKNERIPLTHVSRKTTTSNHTLMFPCLFLEKMGDEKPEAAFFDCRMDNLHWRTPGINYLELLLLNSEAAALAPALARVVGLRTLLGLIAFLILKAAHAVPRA